ncbi:hypothetical protein SAMN05421819_0327 [Bryocella elongata]|uniref:MetS family NSS transporter small subunit n=1 Tax=Bryocella elongata TaxID=863522 RepID=A0A1H5ST67_9BACT|nr:hypothetical protein [Bryocella elongata]SEF53158.1 hypothetical protein SAMN05421819_0327 [Bryocella elongata]
MTTIVWVLAIVAAIWGGSVLALLGIAFWETFSDPRRKGAEPDLVHPSAGRFSRVMAAREWKQDSAT